jgi:LytS/YehU family sensor histidine kinase
VPHLVVQQLVENAVIHGIASSRRPGALYLLCVRSQGNVRITIQNTVGENKTSGIGFGLSSIRTRLRNLYGEDAGLQFSVGSVATATLSLPFLSGADHAGDHAEKGEVCCAS